MICYSITVLSDDQKAIAERDNVVGIGEAGRVGAIRRSVEDQFVTDLLPGLIFPKARVDGFDFAIFKQSEAHFSQQTALGSGFNPGSDDGRMRT